MGDECACSGNMSVQGGPSVPALRSKLAQVPRIVPCPHVAYPSPQWKHLGQAGLFVQRPCSSLHDTPASQGLGSRFCRFIFRVFSSSTTSTCGYFGSGVVGLRVQDRLWLCTATISDTGEPPSLLPYLCATLPVTLSLDSPGSIAPDYW